MIEFEREALKGLTTDSRKSGKVNEKSERTVSDDGVWNQK